MIDVEPLHQEASADRDVVDVVMGGLAALSLLAFGFIVGVIIAGGTL